MTGSQEKIICSFKEADNLEVRISEIIYQDRPHLDIRFFTERPDGEFVPTGKGIRLKKSLSRLLSEALAKTLSEELAHNKL